MFKVVIILLTAIIFSCKAFSQKISLGLEEGDTWDYVDNGIISDDGLYACYQVRNHINDEGSLIIVSTDGATRRSFSNLRNPLFSDKGNWLAGIRKDTLVLINLRDRKCNTVEIASVNEYSFFTQFNKDYLICFSQEENMLRLMGADGDILEKYDSVVLFKLSPDKKKLFIKKRGYDKNNMKVLCVELDKLTCKTIFIGGDVDFFTFDRSGKQLAFISQDRVGKSIWYFSDSMFVAKELVNSRTNGLVDQTDISPNDYWGFSRDGTMLFFSQTKFHRASMDLSNPEIWSFEDLYLLSFFKGKANDYIPNFGKRTYLSAVLIKGEKVLRLVEDSEVLEPISFINTKGKYFVFTRDRKIDEGGECIRYNYGVGNSCSGEKIIIDSSNIPLISTFVFSPDDRYLVYYKAEDRQFYSFDFLKGRKTSISKDLSCELLDVGKLSYPNYAQYAGKIVGWDMRRKRVLVSDSYDIWSLPLDGEGEPKNLTAGRGRKDSVVFLPIVENVEVGGGHYHRDVNDIILKAFSYKSKDFGFYNLSINGRFNLCKLSMGPISVGTGMYKYKIDKARLVESKKEKGFLLRIEKYDDAPNYFFSKDLKNFVRLSNVQPQVGRNWLTAELHTYFDSDGLECQGILYKPENFKSSMRYPIVFNYYEIKSNEINSFPPVVLNGADIDIAYLVSNNYLVFIPDIRSRPGEAGSGLIRSITAALSHLKQFGWIDFNRIAMTGHSFGGWETNYVISHISCHIAAAISAAANSDMVSYSFSLAANGDDRFSYSQLGPFKIGESFADRPDLYLSLSPLYVAKDIRTPILLMHNENDTQIDFSQSLSLFILLRELRKPVWLLSYKGEGHVLTKKMNIIDYKKKMYSFLGYFLKDDNKPEWMKRHVGIDD